MVKTLKIRTTEFTDATIKAFPDIFLAIIKSIIDNILTVFEGCPYTVAIMEDAAAKMLLVHGPFSLELKRVAHRGPRAARPDQRADVARRRRARPG